MHLIFFVKKLCAIFRKRYKLLRLIELIYHVGMNIFVICITTLKKKKKQPTNYKIFLN